MNQTIVRKIKDLGFTCTEYRLQNGVERYVFEKDDQKVRIKVKEDKEKKGVYLEYKIYEEIDKNLVILIDEIIIEELKKQRNYRLKFLMENYTILRSYKDVLLKNEINTAQLRYRKIMWFIAILLLLSIAGFMMSIFHIVLDILLVKMGYSTDKNILLDIIPMISGAYIIVIFGDYYGNKVDDFIEAREEKIEMKIKERNKQ
jgi:hypothetical protein